MRAILCNGLGRGNTADAVMEQAGRWRLSPKLGTSALPVLLRPCALFPLALFLVLLAGSGPAASNFLLLRQKKVTKEKATRSLGPSAALRATCGARAKRGLAKLAALRFAQTTPALIRLSLRSSAQPGRGNRERG